MTIQTMNRCVLIISILIFQNCTGSTRMPDNIPVLHIDTKNISILDLNKISTSNTIIPLETTDFNLIKKIGQVFLIDTAVIVWDAGMHNVHVYNNKGKYLYNIGKRGPGANEYIEIEDVYVSHENKTVSIFDNGKRAVHTYKVTGELISLESIPYYAYSFYPAANGYWLFNNAQNKDKYNLFLWNTKDRKIQSGFLPNKNILDIYPTNNFFHDEDKGLFFHYPNEDIIYRIDGEKLEPYLYVDFGPKKNPYTDINSLQYLDCVERNEYIGNINNLYIHGDKLFFQFSEHFGRNNTRIQSYYAYSSISDLKTTLYEVNLKHSENIPISPLPDIIGLSMNKLIFQINPNILNNDRLMELINKMVQTYGYTTKIDFESNPILIMYELTK